MRPAKRCNVVIPYPYIPVDVVGRILEYFDGKMWLSSRLVCKIWKWAAERDVVSNADEKANFRIRRTVRAMGHTPGYIAKALVARQSGPILRLIKVMYIQEMLQVNDIDSEVIRGLVDVCVIKLGGLYQCNAVDLFYNDGRKVRRILHGGDQMMVVTDTPATLYRMSHRVNETRTYSAAGKFAVWMKSFCLDVRKMVRNKRC